MKKNNLFYYATKELSQDAMLCWLINWINFPESENYELGVSTLNLFLGDKKQVNYFKVEVKRQYKRIDVLVLINDAYALIIEDKTNTSEHGNQIERYKKILQEDFPNYQIITSYIKTGIMYDEDCRILGKTDTVISLEALLNSLSKFLKQSHQEILNDYIEYLKSIYAERKETESKLESGFYEDVLKTAYGQFIFLDRVFDKRSKGTPIGKVYSDGESNEISYIDEIYSGTNNGGTPWTQYCFWGEKYPEQLTAKNKIEYHYLFWRIDCKWRHEKTSKGYEKWIPKYYIALRHYDENAHSKDEKLNNRKRAAYKKFRKIADEISTDTSLYKPIGIRENYKESDLLFIPIENLSSKSFNEIKNLLIEITAKFI